MEPAMNVFLLCGVLTIFNGVVGLSSGDTHHRRTCGTQTIANETSFMNPEYPASETGAVSNCEFITLPMTDNICQIRLDFDEFSLAQPNYDGQCNDAFMSVTGGYSNVPTVCGDNTGHHRKYFDGQCDDAFMTVYGGYSNVPLVCGDNTGHHMYAEVDPSSSGTLKINIDTAVAGAKWNIRITQIECNSLYKAPQGCLQYHTETSGIVSSFNYETSSTSTATRQLANQQYAVCVEARPGYCGLTWEQPGEEGEHFFSLTGDPGSVAPGTPGVGGVGDECQTDYVIIPNAITDTGLSVDRFCGFGFPSFVKSTMSPYTIFVIFNSDELSSVNADIRNQGFSLKYRMNACLSN